MDNDAELADLMSKLDSKIAEQEEKDNNNSGNNNYFNNKNNNYYNGIRNIKFDVSYKTKTETLRTRFNGNDTVGTLEQAVLDELTGNIHAEDKNKSIELVYCGKALKSSNTKLSRLDKIRGNNQSNPPLLITFKVAGGSNNYDNKRERLPRFRKEKRIKPTLDPDCIMGYNEKKLRVKMPCGHSFDSKTIFNIVKMYVNNATKSKILCPMPKCEKEWDFDVVEAAGDLNDVERRNFQSILSKRALIHSGNYQACQGCKGLVAKPNDLKMIRVRCDAKSCQNRSDFCWKCGKDWIGGGFIVCGNKSCPTIEINTHLQTCGTVKPAYLDGKVECPELRVCPRCLTLVGWKSDCKHMKCWGCNKEFCYVVYH